MTASNVWVVRSSWPPITSGRSICSDCICCRRRRSSSRSGVPGAYDFTGSFSGCGGRKRPGAVDIGGDCRLGNRACDVRLLRGRGLGRGGGLDGTRPAGLARAPATEGGSLLRYTRACARDPHPFNGWGELPTTLEVDDTGEGCARQGRVCAESGKSCPPAGGGLWRRAGGV